MLLVIPTAYTFLNYIYKVGKVTCIVIDMDEYGPWTDPYDHLDFYQSFENNVEEY